jgi:peptidoglycan/LPS O-acetylase OafA/YrhL
MMLMTLDLVLAYIGPGAGLGALIVTIALLLGAALLVIGLVWYPLKRVLKARTAVTPSGNRADELE